MTKVGQIYRLYVIWLTVITCACVCRFVFCVKRKSEIEQRNMSKQNKDAELERRVQRLESEKQAVDVCILCLHLTTYFYLFIYLLIEHLHFQRNITAGQQGTNKR